MTDKVFINGMIVKAPHQNAPDFVKAAISFKVDEMIETLQQLQVEGWVNADIKVSQGGKWYAEQNTFKPTQGEAAKAGIEQAKQSAAATPDDFEDTDLPF